MEDPSEDWSLEEDSSLVERNSKLRRLWDGSVSLGKKIVLAGAVVSSAPLVLPSLVALSAFGVAFSVPFGFVFASYACTEKIMSSLLKEPTSPFKYPVSDHGTLNVESGQSFGVKALGSDYEEDYVREAEEEEFGEDEKKWVEMRIEFVDESDGDIKEAESSPKYYHGDVNLDIEKKDVINEEDDGYAEDIDEKPGKQALKSDDVGDLLKGIKEAEEEISSMEERGEKLPTKMADAVLFAAEVGGEKDRSAELLERLAAGVAGGAREEFVIKGELGDIEGEVLKRETTGLIEAMKNEGKADAAKHYLELSRAETPRPTNFENLSTRVGASMSKPTDVEPAKALAEQENIWEQIQAIRIIIGYQAVPNTSCMEELTALFVFTGVEPPVSAKDITEQLRFLKSVIGVK